MGSPPKITQTILPFDYPTLRVPSIDDFLKKLISFFSAKVGDNLLRFIKISFPIIDGVEVCMITVSLITEPAYSWHRTDKNTSTSEQATTAAHSHYLTQQYTYWSTGANH